MMKKWTVLIFLVLITVCLSGFTVFYDNFDFRKNEWQQIRGNWRFYNGFLVQNSADPRHINSIIFVDHPQVADFSIETFVRVQPDLPQYVTGSIQDQRLLNDVRYIIGAGIIFRMLDQNNFYMFRLAGEEGQCWVSWLTENGWILPIRGRPITSGSGSGFPETTGTV